MLNGNHISKDFEVVKFFLRNLFAPAYLVLRFFRNIFFVKFHIVCFRKIHFHAKSLFNMVVNLLIFSRKLHIEEITK